MNPGARRRSRNHEQNPIPRITASGELEPADGTYLKEFRIPHRKGVDLPTTRSSTASRIAIYENARRQGFFLCIRCATLAWTNPDSGFNHQLSRCDRRRKHTRADFPVQHRISGAENNLRPDVNGKEATGPPGESLRPLMLQTPAGLASVAPLESLGVQLFSGFASTGKSVLKPVTLI